MKNTQQQPAAAKVGSDPQAAHDFGGKNDFGISTHDAVVREREGEIVGRPAGSAPGYTGDRGARTTGVGSKGGEPGHDSGGDLDPDIIGLDGRGGLAAMPASEPMGGPDDAGNPSDTFASGKPATGRNGVKPGTHGASPKTKGDFVDHSGDDASTVNPGAAGGVSAAIGNDPGAEGEVSLDEATGNVDDGAEV